MAADGKLAEYKAENSSERQGNHGRIKEKMRRTGQKTE